MELCAPDVEVLHLGILDRHALGIVVVVHVAIDFEAGAGRGGADQTDDGGEGSQRLAAPVLALAQRRYVIRHRLFRIFLACFSFHRVGGPQFSGMIKGVDFGGSAPVLS